MSDIFFWGKSLFRVTGMKTWNIVDATKNLPDLIDDAKGIIQNSL